MATPTQKQTEEISSAMMCMPHEVINEILQWLPAKSLVRFKWVCKYWFDLITRDHDFINMHLLRSNSSSRLWALDYAKFSLTISDNFTQCYIDYTTWVSSRRVTVPYPLIRSHSPCRIFGPCHGLILCSSIAHTTTATTFHDTKLCILNPCTKEYKEIPSAPPLDQGFYKYDYHGCGFDNYGFGYDRTTDDYKVIQVIIGCLDNIESCFLHVYTLRTNSWRIVAGPAIGHTLHGRNWSDNFVFANGDHIYWINDSEAKIVCFDFGKESYEEITNQTVCFHNNLKNGNGKLDMFEGSLSMILCIDDPITGTNYVEMWVMNDNYCVDNNYDDESSWTKLFRTAPSLACSFMSLTSLIFTKSGEIVLMNKQGSLLSYDPKNPTTLMALGFKITWGEEHCTLGVDVLNIVVYIESLISLYQVEKQEDRIDVSLMALQLY